MTKLDSIFKSRYITLLTKVFILKLWFLQQSCADVRVGPQRKLSNEELMLLNCGPREDSWGLLDSKEIKTAYPKGNQPWIVFGRADADAEVPILWPPEAKSHLIGKGPTASKDWGRTKKRKADDNMVGSCDGWMASPTQWTLVWANSGR